MDPVERFLKHGAQLPDLTGQTVLITGEARGELHRLTLWDAQDRRVASEMSPGAEEKLLALAAERGAARAICIFDQRKDRP